MTFNRTLSICTALWALSALPASAHVTLERAEAPRGQSYKAVLKIPHGCSGSPTQAVRVAMPEGFIGAKPMPKAGWTIKTVRGPYAQSYAYYHGPIAEGVTEIEWSGGDLPDDYYDEFVAAGFLARELDPGSKLYFKVVQACAKGEERWVEVPEPGVDPHDLKAPAAVLRIAANSEEGHGARHGHGHSDAHGVDGHEHGSSHEHAGAKAADAAGGAATIGALAVESAWTRATAEGAKVGAGYLTIRNTGSQPDTLVGVETSVAGRGEIHDMTMTDGVMRMRRLADGIAIPAGGSIELKPGGMHLMFMDLKERLVEGGTVTVKLTFKSGATGEVALPVRGLGSSGEDGHHDNHDHDHDTGHDHH